mmetsp:Transcript_15467/g.31864  ORF Transcript_15467/g.31864 Transcript_15467/m.31864 type:complete len:210 (-) Transcript_15467:24-653(-)
MSSDEAPLEDCHYGDVLVERLVSFIAEEKFQREFELFFLEHCRKFDLEGEEHQLHYTDIYNEFEAMFQSRVEEFCEKENVTETEFYMRCKAAKTTDVKASHYLNVMLSSVDYPQFVALMRVMRKLHGNRLDRVDADAEGAAQLDSMLAGTKKKKKNKKNRDGERKGSDDDDDEDDEDDGDFKSTPSSRAESKDADGDDAYYAEDKDAKA